MSRLPMRAFAAVAALAALGTLASVAGAQTTDPAKIEQAKKHMKAGGAFYDDPAGRKCEEAIKEFAKAYELSGSMNALKNMAVCELELERDGDAIEHYTAYLRGKGDKIDPADKQQVETDLAALKAAARVVFQSDRPTVKLTDVRTPTKGYPITNVYPLGAAGRPVVMHPGSHTITASTEGFPDLVWKVEVANGATLEHTFEFEKAKPAEGAETKPEAPADGGARPIPTSVYVAGGGSILLTGITVGLMVRASSAKGEYDSKNHKASGGELDKLKGDVNSANLVADIFLGATVAAIGTTVVLYVTRPKRAPEAPKAGWVLGPTVGPRGGGALLGGTF